MTLKAGITLVIAAAFLTLGTAWLTREAQKALAMQNKIVEVERQSFEVRCYLKGRLRKMDVVKELTIQGTPKGNSVVFDTCIMKSIGESI